jgi:hypothetical protein
VGCRAGGGGGGTAGDTGGTRICVDGGASLLGMAERPEKMVGVTAGGMLARSRRN